MPFPPAVMLTLVLTILLLYAAYVLAPDLIRGPILLMGGLMMLVVAFTSIELTLYLLILSTLLSPELTFGGSTQAQLASGMVNTTESRGVTLRLDDILLTLVCVTWMFRMAIFKELGSVRSTPINQPIAWYWLVALFATVIGMFAGRVGGYGIFFIIKYLEFFVLFYMVINHLHDEGAIKRYLLIMLITCVLASLAGIAQIPSGARVSAPFEGAIGEPNSFGGYLVLMFSVVLGIFLHTGKSRRWYLLLFSMVIILVPLAFTESRSSYLSFVVAILFFIFLSENKRLLIAGCLVAVVLLPFVLPQNVVDRVMFTFDQTEQRGQLDVGGIKIDTSTTERLRAWDSVLTKYFPEHPLLGVGVTGGPFLDAQYPRVLLETGIVGLVLFLWFLRRVWVLLRQCYNEINDPILKGASLGAICGFAGLLTHGIGANTFIIVRIMEPFMILIGLLMAALFIERERVAKKNEQNLLQSDASEQVLIR
ncbi:MAG: O-antigen ligase family protein [Mariprofundaceae bacterium]|nr:O-antigen ligase family protein [Mariprofundaceae bacterium]